LLNSRNLYLLPIDSSIAEQAAELRAQFNIHTPDALQIAAALSAGCEAFLTNDRRLKRVTHLPILLVDEFA
jgi:predicted nucleic acid-binding protein